MSIELTLTYSLAAYLLALVSSRYLAKLYIPVAALFTLLGFLLSESMVSMGHDTGFRYYHFTTLTQNLFIPPIIFSIAIHTKSLAHWRTIASSIYMPTAMYFLTIIIATPTLYFLFNHPTGFPLTAALLAAVILSSTDNQILQPILQKIKGQNKTTTVIQVESVFNEVLAIVLFTFLLSIYTHTGPALPWAIWLWEFSWYIFGAIIIGVAFGYLLRIIMLIPHEGLLVALLTIVMVHLVFMGSTYVGTSGALSVFVFAIMAHKPLGERDDHEFILKVWTLISTFFSLTIFYMIGFSVTREMFTERYLAMFFAIIAITLPRFLLSWPLTRLQKTIDTPLYTTGTVRGVIAIALAFSLPTSLPYWWTIQAMTFGVVIFSIFIHAPIATLWLARKYKVKYGSFITH